MLKFKNVTYWLILGSLIVFSCTRKINGPTEEIFPKKLYPYETYYDAQTFQERRDTLINLLPDNAIIILATNETYPRNGDIKYEFRPASNFFYMTGFDESDAIAIIKKDQTIGISELILFVEERNENETMWLGTVYGIDGAINIFNADTAFVNTRFGQYVSTTLKITDADSIYGNLGINAPVSDLFFNSVPTGIFVKNIDDTIHKLREIKSEIEFNAIQNAVDVSVQAFTEAIQAIEPGMYEYEVEAILDYVNTANGCSRTAFNSIVASGPNMNYLHYDANSRKMEDGDLVMIDFGSEYGYYNADVTRTVPVNGKFSNEQKEIYDIVLDVYEKIIIEILPGVPYPQLYWDMVELIIDRLLDQNIITGNKDKIITSGTYRQYVPAGFIHSIGLDVHDPWSGYYFDKLFKKNMIVALEPHIYLKSGDATVNQNYWGICARIEDEILVTSNGCEILSAQLPRTTEELEDLMK